MESLNFHNIKIEKANAILRYKKRQRMTTWFRFIELCLFFVVISRFSIQLPLSFELWTDYFKGFGVTLISPRFVFVLVNAIVIILFFKSGHSSAKDGSMDNIKFDLYDEYKQACLMNKEAYYEKIEKQSKRQRKQSILVEVANCEQSILVEEANCEQSKKQSTLAERRVEKGIHRSHSDNALNSSHNEEKTRKRMIRSATVGCLKNIETATRKMTTTSFPEDRMSSDEFRKTVEAFIARQQRLLKEEEFSIST
ncbi:uncharacterized protein LOC129884477 [Solanum dulcamara]|uniref:uncharacterized protein LOC129884477 n=1 Tax=Solanum dulcamara TaxID=45834 RepID=UPI002484F329|nr:uncharacterized protein LOC129884477 [Solanum dulcamara]